MSRQSRSSIHNFYLATAQLTCQRHSRPFCSPTRHASSLSVSNSERGMSSKHWCNARDFASSHISRRPCDPGSVLTGPADTPGEADDSTDSLDDFVSYLASEAWSGFPERLKTLDSPTLPSTASTASSTSDRELTLAYVDSDAFSSQVLDLTPRRCGQSPRLPAQSNSRLRLNCPHTPTYYVVQDAHDGMRDLRTRGPADVPPPHPSRDARQGEEEGLAPARDVGIRGVALSTVSLNCTSHRHERRTCTGVFYYREAAGERRHTEMGSVRG
ncbi:hypothetical protein BC629DRAFT_825303 [Irpex lacteus]|nr:hypothetical protein BC629DRAFT_825303 [Irpex lacteus]